jgi:ABC-type transport system involved in multi-copper enzyme maturation permease subunit
LLTAAGIGFEVQPAEVDEGVRPGELPEPYVSRLALDKAVAVSSLRPDHLVLGAGGIDRNLPLAVAVTAMEALIVTSVALFFSTVASPFLSAVFTFLVFVAGHLAGDLKELVMRFGDRTIELLASVMYFVLPSLHQFDVRNNILSGIPVPTGQMLHCLGYPLLYTSAVLLVTIVAFQKRDFE